jgi:excisionase family DNA binding protein
MTGTGPAGRLPSVSEPWKSPEIGPVVNQEEAASILGMHVGTVYRRVREGRMPPPIPGNSGRPIWLREDVERFAEQLKRVPAEPAVSSQAS